MENIYNPKGKFSSLFSIQKMGRGILNGLLSLSLYLKYKLFGTSDWGFSIINLSESYVTSSLYPRVSEDLPHEPLCPESISTVLWQKNSSTVKLPFWLVGKKP